MFFIEDFHGPRVEPFYFRKYKPYFLDAFLAFFGMSEKDGARTRMHTIYTGARTRMHAFYTGVCACMCARALARSGPRAAKSGQRAAKSGQRAAQTAQERPQSGQERPKSSQERPKEPKSVILGTDFGI